MENQNHIITKKLKLRWVIVPLIAAVVLGFWFFFPDFFKGLKATVIATNKIPVFISSQTFPGKLGSIDKANGLCQTAAEIANLEGSWIAFLSSYSQDIKDQLPADKPFVLMNEDQVASNLADLLDGSIQIGITKTEFGSDSIINVPVWTGTAADGKRTDYFCQKGFSNEGTVGMVGQRDGGKWTNNTRQSCNSAASLYCVRNSATSPGATIASASIPASGLSASDRSWSITPSDTVAQALKQKGIKKISIDFKNTAPQNPEIAAKTFRRLEGITPPNGKVGQGPLKILRAFELTPNTALKNELKEAFIEFEMSEKEITQNYLNKANLRLGKFHQGKWREFTPTIVSESNASDPNTNIITYRITIKEFSTFIISSPLQSDPFCGDGVPQTGEACDDGNAIETDACLSTCVAAICGDGIPQANVEQCDDGNANNTDACLANTCKNATCGDGFVKTGAEQCDDGNTASNDGCSATCAIELIENKVKDLAFQDLVAYFPFEEAGQELKDTSGNNRHGTMKNAADGSQMNQTLVSSQDIKKFGKALKLTPDTMADLGDIGDLNDKPVTIAFWAKPEKIGTSSEYGGLLFKKMTSKEKGWKYQLKRDKFIFSAASNDNDSASIDRTESELGGGFANTWSYITIILDPSSVWTFRDSSKTKFYFNGIKMTWNIWPFGPRVSGSQEGFQGKTDIAEPLLIGGNFTGLIDDVRLYNRALSENEIQKLYNAETAMCGNAIMDRNESCDDGNSNEDDGCNVLCQLPVCGDSKVQGAEQCENGKIGTDGKPVADATCSASCRKWGSGIIIVQQTINEGYPPGQQVVRSNQAFSYHLTGNLSPKDFLLDSDTDQPTPYSIEWGTWRNPNTVESGKYVFEQLAKTGGYPGFRPWYGTEKAYSKISWTEDKIANSKLGGPVYDHKNIVELNLDPDETIIVTITNYLLPECADGADNDGDGKIDYKADGSGDPSCDNANDNDEKEYLPVGKEGKIFARYVTRPKTSYDASSWDMTSSFVGPYSLRVQPDNIFLKRDATPGTYVLKDLKTVRNTLFSTPTPNGLTFQELRCEESVTSNSTVNGAEASITLDPSETVTCDFVYTKNQACQNGIKDPWEQCDDGDDINTNACSNACELPRCGDSITQPTTEQCDDGNTVNTDACTNICKTAICGDNIVRPGVEECDDNNTANGDGCDSACKIEPGCGNNHVDPGEQCDDGNTVNTDTCTNTCRNPSCGDSFKQTGEACDDGDGVNNRCTNQCQLGFCGDGIVWEGSEQCDDGDDSNTDGCSIRCNGFGEITLKLEVDPQSAQDFVFQRTDSYGRLSSPASSSDPGSPDIILDHDTDATLSNTLTWLAESRSGGHTVMLQNLPAGFEIDQITWVENKIQNSRIHTAEPRAISINLETNEEITVTFKIKKKPVCSDGIDNDNDGLKDFDGAGDSTKKDPGCDSPNDTSEADPVCGNGDRETGEACDDGGTIAGDGCSAQCLNEQIIKDSGKKMTIVQGSGSGNADIKMNIEFNRYRDPDFYFWMNCSVPDALKNTYHVQYLQVGPAAHMQNGVGSYGVYWSELKIIQEFDIYSAGTRKDQPIYGSCRLRANQPKDQWGNYDIIDRLVNYTITLENDSTAGTPVTVVSGYRMKLPFNPGNIQTNHGTGADGVINGSIRSTDQGCKEGKCLKFDGTSGQKISFSSVPISDSPRTISFWINPSETLDRIIAENASGSDQPDPQWRISLNDERKISYQHMSNATGKCVAITGNAALPKDMWSHIDVTKSYANGDIHHLTLFINGKLESEADIDNPQADSYVHFLIGNGRPGRDCFTHVPSPFVGLLDEFQVANKAFTATEIRASVPLMCGNTILDYQEACDGTSQTMTDNHQQCKQDCSAVEALTWCGDGIKNGSEICDNPDRSQCTALCTLPPRTETAITKPASAQPGDTLTIRFEIRKKANP